MLSAEFIGLTRILKITRYENFDRLKKRGMLFLDELRESKFNEGDKVICCHGTEEIRTEVTLCFDWLCFYRRKAFRRIDST